MNDSSTSQRARRQLFRSLSGHGEVRRPPWTDETLTDRCTRCDACIEACPEGVLHPGGGGFPEIRFDTEGCSLCGDCVDACDASVFDTLKPAFPWQARIQSHCLTFAKIHCQACQEACEWRAITFPAQIGRPPMPDIDADACTGCGVCQALCPTDAIVMARQELADAR